MPIPFNCPYCGHHTEVAEQYAGQRGPCARCGKIIMVPPLYGGPGSPSAPPKRTGAWLTVVIVLAAVAGVAVVCGGLLLAMLLPAMQAARETAREAARQAQCVDNLKQIGLAMHNYHTKYQSFPPAYVTDKDGRPLYSWRVLLLPFMGENDLYGRFHLNEPWDSPHNREVTAECPVVFRCPSEAPTAGKDTNYVMIVGPGMLSDGPSATPIAKITDGTSNTIMVVEVAGSNIPWAAPQDLEAGKITFDIEDEDSETAGISSLHPGGANCLYCDASVRVLDGSLTAEQVRDQCTIAGGEKVEEF